MQRIVLLAVFICVLSACGNEAVTVEHGIAGTNRVSFPVGKRPGDLVTVTTVLPDVEARKLGRMALEWVGTISGDPALSGTNLPSSIVLHYTGSLYRLFYSLGIAMTPAVQVDLFRCGLLEECWQDWQKRRTDYWKKRFASFPDDRLDPFQIEEIRSLFRERGMTPAQTKDSTAWGTAFLLREILFVSVQEFMTRPWRYYQQKDLDSPFFRVVVMPESLEFTRFLVSRFGKDRLVKAARNDYSKENWKKAFGEEVNETEETFTKGIESRVFPPVYRDREFSNRLCSLLKFYNTATKATLFKGQS
jgi:hypothetical protein